MRSICTRNVFAWYWLLGCAIAWVVVPGFAAVTAKADEFRNRQGKHIRLTTDLADSRQLDQWVSTFDAAVPLWAKFWNLPTGQLDDWMVEAFVMKDAQRFQRAGLIDPRVPDFPFAYAYGDQIWVRVQPSDYYTRHLLLHEGVHSLSFHVFGETGPTWFREGVAELLSTHEGIGDSTKIMQIPKSREAAPYWGRFKRMQQLRDAKQVPGIETVLNYEADLRGDVDVYGWSWALVSLLAAYPNYQETLGQAAQHGRDSDRRFNRWIHERLANDWPLVQARWRNLVQDMDYGFDWDRERIQISKADPMWDGKPIQINVQADLGWQSIGVRLNKGMVLQIRASGRITINDDPKPWVSEPSGVTVEYHDGIPLGKLIARIVPNIAPSNKTQSNKTQPDGMLPSLGNLSIGGESKIQIDQPCWLLLRVNDSVGDLSNNHGVYHVQVTAEANRNR